jgi:hypothetical protein
MTTFVTANILFQNLSFSLQQIDKKTHSHHKKYFHSLIRCKALISLVFLGQFLKSYL